MKKKFYISIVGMLLVFGLFMMTYKKSEALLSGLSSMKTIQVRATLIQPIKVFVVNSKKYDDVTGLNPVANTNPSALDFGIFFNGTHPMTSVDIIAIAGMDGSSLSVTTEQQDASGNPISKLILICDQLSTDKIEANLILTQSTSSTPVNTNAVTQVATVIHTNYSTTNVQAGDPAAAVRLFAVITSTNIPLGTYRGTVKLNIQTN